MSAPYIIISSWQSLCQKLSKFVKIWQSYAKNSFDCFLRHGVVSAINLLQFWDSLLLDGKRHPLAQLAQFGSIELLHSLSENKYKIACRLQIISYVDKMSPVLDTCFEAVSGSHPRTWLKHKPDDSSSYIPQGLQMFPQQSSLFGQYKLVLNPLLLNRSQT